MTEMIVNFEILVNTNKKSTANHQVSVLFAAKVHYYASTKFLNLTLLVLCLILTKAFFSICLIRSFVSL